MFVQTSKILLLWSVEQVKWTRYFVHPIQSFGWRDDRTDLWLRDLQNAFFFLHPYPQSTIKCVKRLQSTVCAVTVSPSWSRDAPSTRQRFGAAKRDSALFRCKTAVERTQWVLLCFFSLYIHFRVSVLVIFRPTFAMLFPLSRTSNVVPSTMASGESYSPEDFN